MKVVIFCGGLGTRLRDFSDSVPKPLVPIGYRPVLWHLMMYYAHFGHKDFILCLGYKADKIKEYFLNYNEYLTNDFILSKGGKDIKLLSSNIDEWKITFVDTGLKSNIGQRLKLVEGHVKEEEYFLANYADGLTDMSLHTQIDWFKSTKKTACFLCTKPSQTFHAVSFDERMYIKNIQFVRDIDLWVNAGFFVFKHDIFRYIKDDEDLVVEPFKRLIGEGNLLGYKYDRFWAMDTFKEQQELTDMYVQGNAPWEVWKK